MNCVIFANGDFSMLSLAENSWKMSDLIIATDGGARHCLNLQIIPHLLVGDMDSISAEILDYFTELGSEIHRFPGRKDKTDLELAIDLAISRGCTTILIMGALGGRWDMSIASIMLLASSTSLGITISLRDGSTDFHCVRAGGNLKVNGNPGDTLSLVPLDGPARGVSLSGLEYLLQDEDILPGSTRGISNILIEQHAGISLKDGLLLVIHDRKTPA